MKKDRVYRYREMAAQNLVYVISEKKNRLGSFTVSFFLDGTKEYGLHDWTYPTYELFKEFSKKKMLRAIFEWKYSGYDWR